MKRGIEIRWSRSIGEGVKRELELEKIVAIGRTMIFDHLIKECAQ